MSSTSMRNPIYRDYEKFPYGTMESSLNSTTRNYYNSVQAKQEKNKKKTTKDKCPFCQEQKKRPLGAYMRKRENNKTSESICEEEEHQTVEEKSTDKK